jgi:hypothetical protein
MQIEERSIEDWCIELGLENYKIKDGIVNVNGHVDISKKISIEIPIQFGIVTGYFECDSNKLTSLKGCPKSVGESFNCMYNELTSLKYGPISVGGLYYCGYNNLVSLKYGPKSLGGFLGCFDNPVWKEYEKYNNYNQYMRSEKLKELIYG